jgi:hypothetical protein
VLVCAPSAGSFALRCLTRHQKLPAWLTDNLALLNCIPNECILPHKQAGRAALRRGVANGVGIAMAWMIGVDVGGTFT